MDVVLSESEVEFARNLREIFLAHVPEPIRRRTERGESASADDVRVTQRALAAQGVAVPHWPAAWGGRDWTAVQRHLWTVELALAHVPPLNGFNTQMVGPVLATFGTPEQQARFLPATANLDIWWCQGFSEPEAGSDLASLRTTAERDGDDFVVNGQKTWTTSAQHADWMFCLVRTDRAQKKQQGISFLLLDMTSPGITVRPIELLDGSAEVNEVFLDDVRVPADQLVGELNRGWDYAKFLLSQERTGVAKVGLIKARIGRIKRAAAVTTARGAPLAEDPVFLDRLTRLEVETMALEMAVLRVLAQERARPGMPNALSSVLKLKGSQLQQEATELLVEVLGPAAIVDRRASAHRPEFTEPADGATDALATYLNWRKVSIYSGSSEIQRSIIAKSILKL